MAAYVIVDINIRDHEKYELYKQLTPASIAEFGGKFVVRGGATVTMEGDWVPGRIVVAEFPNMETAKAWWNSEGYAEAKRIRQASADTRMIFVEGI